MDDLSLVIFTPLLKRTFYLTSDSVKYGIALNVRSK